MYEELDYLVTPKEDLLGGPGFLSDDSLTKLSYDAVDAEGNSDYKSTPEPPEQRTDDAGEGYDDVEEVPAPGAPPASPRSEGEVPPEKENGVTASQTGFFHVPPGKKIWERRNS
eukprot:bmy_11466T0